MGLLSRLFGSKEKDKAKKEIKKTIEYDEYLIEELKDDHLELFDIFGKIKETFEKNPDFSHELAELLGEFKTGLEMHVLVEDNKLYTYLEDKYCDNDMHRKMIHDLQKQMTSIVKSVLFFTKKYSNRENFIRNKDKFLKDLSEVGDALTKRTSMEERKLYTMYEK